MAEARTGDRRGLRAQRNGLRVDETQVGGAGCLEVRGGTRKQHGSPSSSRTWERKTPAGCDRETGLLLLLWCCCWCSLLGGCIPADWDDCSLSGTSRKSRSQDLGNPSAGGFSNLFEMDAVVTDGDGWPACFSEISLISKNRFPCSFIFRPCSVPRRGHLSLHLSMVNPVGFRACCTRLLGKAHLTRNTSSNRRNRRTSPASDAVNPAWRANLYHGSNSVTTPWSACSIPRAATSRIAGDSAWSRTQETRRDGFILPLEAARHLLGSHGSP